VTPILGDHDFADTEVLRSWPLRARVRGSPGHRFIWPLTLLSAKTR
jgi:hypothetical protein